MQRAVLIACCIASLPMIAPFSGAQETPPLPIKIPAFALQCGGSECEGTTFYEHTDCVGPGLPGTRPPHITHTDRVVFPLGVSLLQVITLSTRDGDPGPICPLAAEGSIVRDDFTGHYRLTEFCDYPPGSVGFVWDLDVVAGVPVAERFRGGTCSASVQIQTEISPVLGLPLRPLGGVTARFAYLGPAPTPTPGGGGGGY